MSGRDGTTFRIVERGGIRNVTNLGLGRYYLVQLSYNLRLYRRQGNAVERILEAGK